MKRNWQPEELIEHWTLIPSELELLIKKTATNRLGIALLLKYFQYEGRFPTSKAEIPRDVICYRDLNKNQAQTSPQLALYAMNTSRFWLSHWTKRKVRSLR